MMWSDSSKNSGVKPVKRSILVKLSRFQEIEKHTSRMSRWNRLDCFKAFDDPGGHTSYESDDEDLGILLMAPEEFSMN